MKRNVFALFLVIVFVYSTYTFGVLTGNPVGFPDEKKFSFQGQYWNIDTKDIAEFDDGRPNELTSEGEAFQVSYGLTDILSLDIRLGQADFGISDIYPYEEGIMWGLGVRALIFQSANGFRLMSGFQYDNFSPDNAEGVFGVFEGEPESSVLSIDISKEFVNRVTLYGGVDYSYFTFKYFHAGLFGQREGGYEQDKEVGYYGGVDFKLFQGFSLFAEGHFENEDAYVIGLLYKLTGKESAPEAKTPAAPPEGEKSGIFAGRFHVEGEWSRLTDKKMTEQGGFVPEYDKYRMSSDRMFAVFSYDIIDRISIFTKLGSADLETHSSEGETTDFDSEFVYAIGSKGKLFEIAKGTWLTAEIGYLSYEPEDEENISTAKHALNTPGDLSIEWSELNVNIGLSKKIGNTELFGGVEYLDVTADQDREFASGEIVSSSFDAEDNVGLFAGFQYWFTETFSMAFRADIITERQYTIGGSFSF